MEVPLKKIIWLSLFALAGANYDFVVKPEFGEKPKDVNVTSFEGQTSRLPCTVKHLAGKRVSWIRQRDLQVLSTGRITFSTDMRISVLPGTKFHLRKPRDLLGEDSLQYPSEANENESQMAKFPLGFSRWSFDLDKNKKESLVILRKNNQSQIYVQKLSPNDKSCGNDCYSQSYTSHELQRQSRSIGHRQHRKQMKYLHNYWETYHVNPLALKQIYRSKRNSRRSKKELTVPFQSQEEFIKVKHQELYAKESNMDKLQSYARQNSPIAIYPQGSVSSGSDGKTQQPGPNYIDGVWEPEDYTLQIKFTKPEDAGIYICQINTEPRITQAVTLRVVKMKAEILGRRELFVKVGNPVRLSCRVSHGVTSPGFILWYKGDHLVEYENSGGRIQVMTEAGGVSHLLLQNAQPEDSANYTCSPAGGAPASLILNVIVDERQAAMQQGNKCPLSPCPSTLLQIMMFVSQLFLSPSFINSHFSSFIITVAVLSFTIQMTFFIKTICFLLLISDYIFQTTCSVWVLFSAHKDALCSVLQSFVSKRPLMIFSSLGSRIRFSSRGSCLYPFESSKLNITIISIVSISIIVLFVC